MARAKRESDLDEKVIASSGNAFADLGLPNAEELQTKVKIAFALNTIIGKLGRVTQAEVASRLHTDQPKVSALRNYKLEGLSVERLLGFLTALDYDIDIRIKRAQRRRRTRQGRIDVSVSAA